MAAAYLTISSYCCSISSQSIGLERIGSKLESRVRMPAWGRASFWRATAFSRGESSNPRSRQNAKTTALWPWLSTYWRWISQSVQWRSTPSIMEATSEEATRLRRDYKIGQENG